MTDTAGLPTAVVWSKTTVGDTDDQFYTVSMRITVPDTPFTTLYFPAIQTCRASDGTVTVVEWIGLPGDPEEPAPALVIMPARYPGWNKITPTVAITDLSLFDDAQIVWQGNAAYSSNPAIMDLITSESGVTVLSELAAGTDVWVKY
jgi:hypothetical protein